jgi:hypothetical protein
MAAEKVGRDNPGSAMAFAGYGRFGLPVTWHHAPEVTMAPATTILAVLALGLLAAGPAAAAEEGLPAAVGGQARVEAKAPQEEVNTGQDPTRPVTRLDARFKYVELDHKAVGAIRHRS